MTDLTFIKMHGAGNDYVFIDGFETEVPSDPAQLPAVVSNRNFGVGADGLVVILPPSSSSADAGMRMWNADGSEGSMCGNAARCVALWMELTNRVSGACRIETSTRVVSATTIQLDRQQQSGMYSVNLGSPIVNPNVEDLDCLSSLPVGDMAGGLRFQLVDLGNPHAVVFANQLTDRLVRHVGSAIENHPRFPDGTNVEWLRLISDSEIEVRVWERGSGETLACGSGACAAVVCAISQGHCDRNKKIRVNMTGGMLDVQWLDSDQVVLSGPAEVSFLGTMKIGD